MNVPPYRQVLECASLLALSDLVRRRKSGRGLPPSGKGVGSYDSLFFPGPLFPCAAKAESEINKRS